MNDVGTIATWDALQALGFQPDEARSKIAPGLSFNFGNFELSANRVVNKWLREVIWLYAAVFTPRSMGEVIFEMPLQIESAEHCAALIAYHLQGRAPAREPRWLVQGRRDKVLLPWRADLAGYEERPRCAVERAWMRLMLKTLRELLVTVDDEAPVVLGFDGGVLTIRCGGKVIAAPGDGVPWLQQFVIPAGKLRRLPQRLMRAVIDVSIWKSRLMVDRSAFHGIEEVPAGAST